MWNQILKCFDLFGGKLCNTSKCSLTRILSGEKYFVTESVKSFDNINIIDVECSVSAFINKDEFAGFIGTYRDITKKKIGTYYRK